MQPALIHLEHALPALAELGLEHLVPLLGGQGLEPGALAAALQGLAGGADKRAARLLVAVSKATGMELLGWEGDPALKERALADAALTPFDQAKEAVVLFFASLGTFQPATPDSSEPGKAAPAMPEPPASAPAP